jgi:hypothetical protein
MKVHVHWMNLMKNQIIQNFQSLEILKKRATKKKTQYLNHLTKKLCLNCLALCAGYMCKK